MKKLSIITALTLSLIGVIIWSCKKEKNQIISDNIQLKEQKVSESKMSDNSGNNVLGSGEEEEMKKNLILIAMGLLDLSRDRSFVNKVNIEARQQRDSDFDVIIIPPSPPNSEERPPLCWLFLNYYLIFLILYWVVCYLLYN